MTDIKEAQGLEVVATEANYLPDGAIVYYDLCRLSDATAVIDQQAARIALYERALLVSWPEGAKGEVCDLWNEARTMGSKGDGN